MILQQKPDVCALENIFIPWLNIVQWSSGTPCQAIQVQSTGSISVICEI